MDVLKLFLLTLLAISGVASEEETVNSCDLSTDPMLYYMYCNCDNEDQFETEEVRCNAWGSPSDPEKLWTALSNLKSVTSLEFNMRPERALNIFLPSRVFESMDKLSIFNMKLANIAVINSFAFANSSSISELVLKDNLIHSLEVNSFSNMINVSKINLGNNLLTEVKRDVFIQLPNLQSLYLDRNKIQVVHDRAFEDLYNLEELDLQKNMLSVIARDVFSGLKKLVRLDLQGNMIELLGHNVFGDMPLLEELDLHENQIQSISPTAFSNLKSLRRLNLKENKIASLEPSSFQQLGMIYMLDLRENLLETLNEGIILPIYDNLKNASMQFLIEGNRLVCGCPLLWMSKLYEETDSDHVKRHLEMTQCDNFHSSEGKHHNRHVSYDANVTVGVVPPEETTTYSFDGMKNVLQLSPIDFKCHDHHHHHHQQDQKDFPSQDGDGGERNGQKSKNDKEATDNKKDLPHQYHQSHRHQSSASGCHLKMSSYYLTLIISIVSFNLR